MNGFMLLQISKLLRTAEIVREEGYSEQAEEIEAIAHDLQLALRPKSKIMPESFE